MYSPKLEIALRDKFQIFRIAIISFPFEFPRKQIPLSIVHIFNSNRFISINEIITAIQRRDTFSKYNYNIRRRYRRREIEKSVRPTY